MDAYYIQRENNNQNKLTFQMYCSKNHLCFKQAHPKMYHYPKVDDGVDIFIEEL